MPADWPRYLLALALQFISAWSLLTLGLPRAFSEVQDNRLLTQSSELRAWSKTGERIYRKARLDGTVLVAGATKGLLAIQDNSGIILLKTELETGLPRAGEQIILEGACAVEGSTISFGRVPLVDNDGLHPIKEKSAQVYLRPGKHALRLIWFDAGGDAALEAYMAGPKMVRQKIPEQFLFHKKAGAESGGWSPGLKCRVFEGDCLSTRDLGKLKRIKEGIAPSLDLAVCHRTNQVGLEFTGVIEIPEEGAYTFSILSDDGAQLFIDDEAPRIIVVGTNALPVAQALPEIIADEPVWSQVEGRVVFAGRQFEGGELEMRVGGRTLQIELLELDGFPPEAWLHARVRVVGVAQQGFTSDGILRAERLLVSGAAQVQMLQPSPEQWAFAVQPIAQVLEHPPAVAPGFVHLRAEVLSNFPPSTLLLADRSGTIQAEMTEHPNATPGDLIEVFGVCRKSPSGVRLTGGVMRTTIVSEGAATQRLPLLTAIDQVHRLKRTEAELGYPVFIRGVVTCAWDGNANGMLQDSTRGIFIPNLAPNSASTAKVGDYLEVEGFSGAGDFAPVINTTRVTYLGHGRLPDPARPTWDQLVNGSMDCQFVELEGMVTSIQTNGFTLLMRGGTLQVELDERNATSIERFANAKIRLRGALSALWDGTTHEVVSGTILFHPSAISIEEPAPSDLFGIPFRSVEELRQFDAQASALQRVKLAGQIIHRHQMQYWLKSGTNSLLFFAKTDRRPRLGDQVVIVGFPDIDGASLRVREAVVRVSGNTPLPEPHHLKAGVGRESAAINGHLVDIQSLVLGVHSEGGAMILDLQDGPQTFVARLEDATADAPSPRIGSLVRVTGVYVESQAVEGSTGLKGFQLLLNSPLDIVTVARPSWWTTRHSLGVAAFLAAVLLLAIAWISSLRRQVNQRTAELKAEIDGHKRTESEVKEQARLLSAEIEERKRVEQEVERVHQKLLMTSRQAGMAEVATSVLHNVGNVLNSVNISASVIAENLRRSKSSHLLKLSDLLAENASSPGFLEADEKGRKIPDFLRNLGQKQETDQRKNLQELHELQSNIDHIKRIVAMQQDHARIGGVAEKARLSEIVEDSIRINAASLSRHRVELIRDFRADPELQIEKHKVLQILVNLIQNAKLACIESGRQDSQVVVEILPRTNQRIAVQVKDNGIGISADNLGKIFTAGFTTRKNGHGFGLHSCIIAARELKGALTVESEGSGRGAAFCLELPLWTDSAAQ